MESWTKGLLVNGSSEALEVKQNLTITKYSPAHHRDYDRSNNGLKKSKLTWKNDKIQRNPKS